MSRSTGRRKLLFLVHVEPMFEKFFPENYLKFVQLAARKFDRVIALDSQVDIGVCPEVQRIDGVEIMGWGWGYERGEDYGNGIENTIVSYGHEATWVPDWLLEMNVDMYDVVIAGGYDTECLEDWRCVLDYLSIPFREWRHIVY